MKSLRMQALLLLLAAGGCGSEMSDVSVQRAALESDGTSEETLIPYHTYYSAFDGFHDYNIPVVPQFEAYADDPIVPSTVAWHIDPEFVEADEYPDEEAAVKLTTRNGGRTTLRVEAQTESGRALQDEAIIQISLASPEQWEHGDEEFASKDPAWPDVPVPEEAGCAEQLENLPDTDVDDYRCPSCHSHAASITVPFTAQIASLSDEQLIQLFSEGVVPAGMWEHQSPAFKNAPPEFTRCAMLQTHSWAMTDEVKLALLAKVRSELPFETAPAPNLPPTP